MDLHRAVERSQVRSYLITVAYQFDKMLLRTARGRRAGPGQESRSAFALAGHFQPAMAQPGKNLVGPVYDEFVGGPQPLIGAPRWVAQDMNDISGRRIVGGFTRHMNGLLSAALFVQIINDHVGFDEDALHSQRSPGFVREQIYRQDAAG